MPVSYRTSIWEAILSHLRSFQNYYFCEFWNQKSLCSTSFSSSTSDQLDALIEEQLIERLEVKQLSEKFENVTFKCNQPIETYHFKRFSFLIVPTIEILESIEMCLKPFGFHLPSISNLLLDFLSSIRSCSANADKLCLNCCSCCSWSQSSSTLTSQSNWKPKNMVTCRSSLVSFFRKKFD